LQEDNAVASTHNFHDTTINLPYNRQYYPQGGRDNQPARWIPPQEQQAQPRQPYTYKLLQRIANQSTVNPQAQAQPSSPLPSQPLPNPKGGINAVQLEEEEDEVEDEDDENGWLHELLKKMANSDDKEDEESEDESGEEDEDESMEEGSEDEFVNEGDQTEEEAREEDRDKGKIFFINTLFKEKKNEEEVPIKCGDPGPCLVTCNIRGISIPDCLCDHGACRNIMPFEVYEL
ncbi:hypothetical protein PIB30_089040, partial [Stylosanthes scabra]|nr:hypothetical protein [Stylosanthes scabra]